MKMLPRHDIVRAVLISSLMPLQCEVRSTNSVNTPTPRLLQHPDQAVQSQAANEIHRANQTGESYF